MSRCAKRTPPPPRMEWPTGAITEANTASDNLVRRVMVQPHKRHGKSNTDGLRQRAVHHLVFIKRSQYKDHPSVMVPDGLTYEGRVQAVETALAGRALTWLAPTDYLRITRAQYKRMHSPSALRVEGIQVDEPIEGLDELQRSNDLWPS